MGISGSFSQDRFFLRIATVDYYHIRSKTVIHSYVGQVIILNGIPSVHRRKDIYQSLICLSERGIQNSAIISPERISFLHCLVNPRLQPFAIINNTLLVAENQMTLKTHNCSIITSQSYNYPEKKASLFEKNPPNSRTPTRSGTNST